MPQRIRCAQCQASRVARKIVGSYSEGPYHWPYCEDCLRAEPALAQRPHPYWAPDPEHVRRVLVSR